MSYQSRQLMQQITKLQRDRDRLIQPEVSPDLISPFLALPMLRGFWAGTVSNLGNWRDISGMNHILLYRGNPVHTYFGPAPFWAYDGTGDYHDITDAASGNNFDITGGETYVQAAAQGLTVGGWFRTSAPAAQQGLITKYIAGQESYWMQFLGSTIRFEIHDGAAIRSCVGSAIVANTWYFCAGRFSNTNDELAVWLNEVKTTLAIPAGLIQSANADLVVGGFSGGALLLTGWASLCFICAAACSDAMISSIFQQTRAAFGV